ncbi:MAG TPA: hypothetical protein VEL31_00540 [Ktedonobacteraceae bacterium]|nr:hypothetical protein [Ktedonobacteraceae bacterium]
MSLRVENLDAPGHIQLVSSDGACIQLTPEQALELLQWLFERQDAFQEALLGSQETAQLPRGEKRDDLPDWVQ